MFPVNEQSQENPLTMTLWGRGSITRCSGRFLHRHKILEGYNRRVNREPELLTVDLLEYTTLNITDTAV